MEPTKDTDRLVVYRVEIEAGGRRKVWALLAADFVEAARLASAAAPAPGDRVVAVHPVGELL